MLVEHVPVVVEDRGEEPLGRLGVQGQLGLEGGGRDPVDREERPGEDRDERDPRQDRPERGRLHAPAGPGRPLGAQDRAHQGEHSTATRTSVTIAIELAIPMWPSPKTR